MKYLILSTFFAAIASTTNAEASSKISGTFYALPNQSMMCHYVIDISRSQDGTEIKIKQTRSVRDPYGSGLSDWTDHVFVALEACGEGPRSGWSSSEDAAKTCVTKDDPSGLIAGFVDRPATKKTKFKNGFKIFPTTDPRVLQITSQEGGQGPTCYYSRTP